MDGGEVVSRRVGHGGIEVVAGNLVEQQVEAIVNAANTRLSGGGGVDGALHRAAGPALREECARLPADERGRRCPTGQVRVTGAGALPARFVLHAVGPFYNSRYAEKAERQLREAYGNALAAAAAHGCRSVALPALSTGAYRFPLGPAAAIALRAAADFLAAHALPEVVRFVLLKPAVFEAFAEALGRLGGGTIPS
jgi:O-acetyl-ADP-ribose deacetylase (regulator of RNase III)